MRQKSIYLACFLLHFLLVITVSARETVWLLARGLTIFPSSFKSYAQKAETVTSVAMGQNLAAANPIRRALATYLHIVGIERGYGYFAPNVPGSYKLVFELQFADGRVEYELPRVSSAAAGLRVAALLDELGRTRNDALREYMVKLLADSIWREHPDAMTIRAVFGSISLPTVNEFEQGQKPSYEFWYGYDFSRREESTKSENP